MTIEFFNKLYGNALVLSNLRGQRRLPYLPEVEDIIFLTKGEFVHPRAVWEIFKGRNEVLQYQLIQHEPECFELRLVTVDSQTYQHVIGGILADLRHLLGDSVNIESEYNKELERQSAGKFRLVISLCKQKGFV